MSNNLQGKVALVTGGSRGIGAAIVKRLAGMMRMWRSTYVSNPGRSAQEFERSSIKKIKEGDMARIGTAYLDTDNMFPKMEFQLVSGEKLKSP